MFSWSIQVRGTSSPWGFVCGPIRGADRCTRARARLKRRRRQAYVLTGASAFQYLTPFGGLAMMGGWAALGAGVLLEQTVEEEGRETEGDAQQ